MSSTEPAPYETLIQGINTARDEIVLAEARVESANDDLERARTGYTASRSNTQTAIFRYMAGEDEEVRGERAFDFIEASMRINGASRSHAAKKAGELATLFLSDEAPSRPIYFGNTIYVPGSVLEGGGEPSNLSIVEREGRQRDYGLVVRSGRRDIFAGDRIAEPGFLNRWVLRNESPGFAINFDDIGIIEENGQRSGSQLNIDVGNERIESVLSFIYPQNPETVALLALIRISSGAKPAVPFVDIPPSYDFSTKRKIPAEAHQQHTLDDISGYIRRIFKRHYRLPPEYGLPVRLHRDALDYQGIDRQAVDYKIGCVVAGSIGLDRVMKQSDVDLISQRIKNGKKPQVGQVIDKAIAEKARVLEDYFDEAGLSDVLGVSAQTVLATIIENPNLYFSSATLPFEARGTAETDIVEKAIETYIKRSPRFSKEAKSDFFSRSGY